MIVRYIVSGKLQVAEWETILEWAGESAHSFCVSFPKGTQAGEPSGLPGYGYDIFVGQPDVEEKPSDSVVVVSGSLSSMTGQRFVQHLALDVPGVGRPIANYDLLRDNEPILSVRDLSDVFVFDDTGLSREQFAARLQVPEDRVRVT